jgi:hypothetical protein
MGATRILFRVRKASSFLEGGGDPEIVFTNVTFELLKIIFTDRP